MTCEVIEVTTTFVLKYNDRKDRKDLIETAKEGKECFGGDGTNFYSCKRRQKCRVQSIDKRWEK